MTHRISSGLQGGADLLQKRVEVAGVFAANAQVAAANMPKHVNPSTLSRKANLILRTVRDEEVVL